ncbi:MAG: pantoate--beta-alanine ligase [Bacteroidales bacterium]|jgi:pantoate--beta-alanine ligase|nr:pantoate--beta-alanine ligase [Bacteroidales bacterium]
MTICYNLADFKQALSLIPNSYKIGFVPTMGALHHGHISLAKRAKDSCNIVIVSIFVNPTQFNNPADLARYPRTLEDDCKKLEEAGVALLFVPGVKDIYPQSDNRIFDLGGLDSTGEGPRRPGHFNGVAQVVTRLFDIVKPNYAFFGEKDFQQLSIIKHFTKEMQYPVEIIACPTIRESDGLAMSSRNTLLTKEQREAAPEIYRALVKAREVASAQILSDNGNSLGITPAMLSAMVADEINSNPLLETEYAEIVNSLTLQIVTDWADAEELQLCVAVNASPVRLIDNIKLK